MQHELKILPQWFEAVERGDKNFEIRTTAKDYAISDELVLREWDEEQYTGRVTTKTIQYIYKGDGSYGLEGGYCVLGLTDTTYWVDDSENGYRGIHCFRCGFSVPYADTKIGWRYCPGCGARIIRRNKIG